MISRHNLAVLISANLLRIGLSLILIFQTNWNNIVKTYLLFFPFALESVDGAYPSLFKILKPEKDKKCYNYIYGHKVINPSSCFSPWYDILDKISDLIVSWAFLFKIYKDRLLSPLEVFMLFAVLYWRTVGDTVFWSTLDKRILLVFPNFFDLFCMSFFLVKDLKLRRAWWYVFIIISILVKIYQEWRMHANPIPAHAIGDTITVK